MVSKNELKYLCRLGQKKIRTQYGVFPVEGKKAIETFLANGFKIVHCFGFDNQDGFPVEIISKATMKKLSNHKTPPSLWAAFSVPKTTEYIPQALNLALDGIRDPGNLGTIIRLCDWFGIQHLLCSADTVDCFNPKTVQASMGSLANVHVHYGNLINYFQEHKLDIIATAMDGENMHQATLPPHAVIVVGNEGTGISAPITALAKKNIAIPNYGKPAAESLNVAIATGIILSEFRRRG